MSSELDKTDRLLVRALQENARLTSGELAQRVNLSQSPSWRRIKHLEDDVCAIPEVVMFHGISGPEDFLLVIVARDLDAYSELLQHKLHRLPGVRQVHTHFSLQEFKGRIGGLPVPL